MDGFEDTFSSSKILSDIDEKLTEKDVSTYLRLDDETFDALVNREKVEIGNIDGRYFCPLFLCDEKSGTFYPLFFFESVIDNETTLSRSERLPIFNKVALSVLSQEGVDADDLSRIYDIKSYLFSLIGSIETRGLQDRFTLHERLRFYDEDVLYLSRSYPILTRYSQGIDQGERYSGLLNHISDPEFEKESARDEGLFSDEYQMMIARLDHYECSKALFSDERFIDDFLIYLISSEISVSEELVFLVSDDAQEDRLKRLFSENDLGDFVSDLSDLSLSLLDEKMNISSSDSEAKRAELQDIESRYLSLIDARNRAYSNPRDLYNADIISDILRARDGDLRLPPADLDDYSSDDFRKDYRYLSSIENYDSISDIDIRTHVFYGLSVSAKLKNYDEFIMVTIKLSKAIDDLVSCLESEDITDFDGEEISSFSQFEEYGQDIAVLASYNGFPRKYFKLDQQESLEKITSLRSLYQSLSSTRLLISKICDEKIFDQDIEKLLDDCDSRFFLKRRHAKKRLLSYLITKNSQSFDSFRDLLSKYISYQDQIEAVLPEYIEEFGPSVTNMNSLIEMESNIRCVVSFFKRAREHPSYNMENPLVKRCYKDKDLRNEKILKYRKADERYQAVKDLLNQYRGYLLGDSTDLMKLSFSELSAQLSRKLSGTYQEFYQYADFRTSLDGVSKLLRTRLISYLSSGRHLSEFKPAFVYSLAEAIYRRGRKRFRPQLEEYEKVKDEYLSLLDENHSTYEEYLRDHVAECIDEKIHDPTSERRDAELLISHQRREIDPTFVDDCFKQEAKRRPIIIARPHDLLYLGDDVIDKMIVSDTTRFDYPELLSLLSASRHLLLLERPSEFDKRTQGYPTTSFSNNFYLRIFDFSTIPSSLIDDLNMRLSERGYTLRSSDIFPYSIYDEKDELVGLILPDVLIPKDKEAQVRSQLRRMIQNIYHVPLIIMSTIAYLMEPEQTMSSLLERIERATGSKD